MSAVGDLLELLHGASERWTTVAATARTWRQNDVAERARERWDAELSAAGHGGNRMIVLAGVGERPAVWDHSTRFWIAKPDRRRQEDAHGVRVARGTTWWSHSPSDGFMTNEGDPEVAMGDPLESFGVHLDPARVLPALRFESVDERGGVLLVRARSRRVAARFLFFGMGLGEGADEHELQIEPERGVVLRVESRLEGEPFHVSELLDARFDEELPDELFTLELPPGERAVSPRELHAHNLPLEEIAEQASFTVFAIAELPEGAWRVHAHHTRPHGGTQESVALVYHRADGRGAIVVTERRADAEGPPRFPGDRRAVVTVERDGTRIELASEELGEDELRALADGLVRA